MGEKTSNKIERCVFYFFSMFIGFLILNLDGFSWYNNDFTTYGVNALARLGKYPNYFVADSVRGRITPQILSDWIILFLEKLGLNYRFIMTLLYILSCIILITGIVYALDVFSSEKMKDREKFIVLLISMIFLFFNYLGNTISGNLLWSSSYYHQSVSIALVVWSIALSQNNKWKSSFIVCMIATLFQMHVGTYAFLASLISITFIAIKEKRISLYKNILWWIIPIVPFVLLILFSNDKGIFTNKEYVELYGRLRHPHHMIPSTWPFVEFIKYGLIIICIYIISRYIFKLSREWNLLFIIYAILSGIGIIINWSFTDIYPLSVILKLQPARMITIMNLLILFTLLQYIMAGIKTRDPLLVLYLLFVSISSRTINLEFIVYLIFVGIIAKRRKSKNIDIILESLLGILFVIGLKRSSFSIRHIFIILVIAGVITLLLNSKSLDWLRRGGIFLLLGVNILNAIYIPNYCQNNIDLQLLDLAERFKNNTKEGEEYFADPLNSNLASFALFSERGTYCFYKNVPIFDKALLEWKNRLEKCGIIQQVDEKYVLQNMNLTEEEQIQLCKEYKIRYILIAGEIQKYLDTGFVELIDKSGEYTILKILM